MRNWIFLLTCWREGLPVVRRNRANAFFKPSVPTPSFDPSSNEKQTVPQNKILEILTWDRSPMLLGVGKIELCTIASYFMQFNSFHVFYAFFIDSSSTINLVTWFFNLIFLFLGKGKLFHFKNQSAENERRKSFNGIS